MKRMLMGMILLSIMGMADFSRSDSGVVTDSVTGLQWQDDYSDNGDKEKAANWEDAITYCESLELDGGGWRLPNINELNSIIDLNRTSPAIDAIFQYTQSDDYWSSTTNIGYSYQAWSIYFGNGYRNVYDKSDSNYVRCVRSRL